MAGVTPPAPSVTEIAVDVLYYVGLSTAVGVGVTIAALALPSHGIAVVANRVARLAVPAAIFVVVTGTLNFLASAGRTADTGLLGGLDRQVLSAFVNAPPAHGNAIGMGTTSLMQLGGHVVVAAALLWLSASPTRLTGCAVVVSAVLTAAIPELPYAAPTFARLAGASLTIAHIVGALFWIGGLIVLAAAGLIGRLRPNSDPDVAGGNTANAEEWQRVWQRFSIVALYAVGAIILSGSWLAFSHVGTPAQLLTTSYGRYLTIKLVVVAMLLVAGAYNVRVLLPKIRAAQHRGDTASALRIAAHHFPVVVAGETVLAIAVLGIVPFLRGSARNEAGGPSAAPFDVNTLGAGLILLALVAAVLWVGSRENPRKVGRTALPDRSDTAFLPKASTPGSGNR